MEFTRSRKSKPKVQSSLKSDTCFRLMGSSNSFFKRNRTSLTTSQPSLHMYFNKGPETSIKAIKANEFPIPSRDEKSKMVSHPSFKRNFSGMDTEQYREGYPGKKDNHNLKDNLLFYKNLMASRPNGDYIDRIHKHWHGDHRLLESHHGYIQWIFPIRESGMNRSAQELQMHEAKAIQSDPACRARVLKSYRMMLDFYGLCMPDSESGGLERADSWQERFAHLNRSFHNYLRITRMLKSLGELGLERLKAPFIEFMLREALDKRTLPNVVDSARDYWIHTVRDDEERCRLRVLAEQLAAGPDTEV